MKNVFIVWTKYQARVEGIVSDLRKEIGDFQIVYRDNPSAGILKKILNYLRLFVKDYRLLTRNSYDNCFVQVPPTYSLLAPLLYRRFSKRKFKIIADCHNAITRKPWLKSIGIKRLLGSADLLIFHNEIIYARTKEIVPYIADCKKLVLEDKTPHFVNIKKEKIFVKKPFVFFPTSFNLDEPIKEVIKAAQRLPEFSFVLTGSHAKMKKNFNLSKKDLPSNVIITGWLEDNLYLNYLEQADVLLGLTIYDDIQMSVSNEGLGAHKKMVLSDKVALKKIYQDGVLYTKNDEISISNTIRRAYNSQFLYQEINKARRMKDKRYNKQLILISEKIMQKGL
ncbi:hypothetical protein [Sporolactobacillus sp. KGMB 08714]|uniref:hypothetical protein n=1 Tax=Sporolactobacillus sp. KGMB 08714 TaxID=3064704 RepID=UPI002FBDDBA2